MSTFSQKIRKERKDIFRYQRLIDEKNFISPKYFSYPDSDFTPLQNVEDGVFFKREDLSFLGSHKERSLAYQVAFAKTKKVKLLAISTSGNAGIAASYFAKEAGIPLIVFTSHFTIKAKIKEMQKYDPLIIITKRSYELIEYVKNKFGAFDLRPSRDNNSISGLKSLGYELFEQLSDLNKGTAIFMTVSSGSSLLGLHYAFKALQAEGSMMSLPELNAAQRGKINKIAGYFDTNFQLQDEGKNDQTIWSNAKIQTPRTLNAIRAIEESGGFGWMISDEQFLEAKKKLLDFKIDSCDESIMAFAGYLRACRERLNFKRAVIIISGKKYDDRENYDKKKVHFVENEEKVGEIVLNCD